jgi:hypothetical protein
VPTPGYTVLVVDAGGVIRHCAKYVRRWALGKPWANVRQILHQQHGSALRVVQIL